MLDWKDYRLEVPDESGTYVVIKDEGRRRKNKDDLRKVRAYQISIAYWDAEKGYFTHPSFDAFVKDWAKIDPPSYLQRFEAEGEAREVSWNKPDCDI